MALEGLDRMQVYQEAQELAKLVYETVLPNLPPEEKWGLASQIRRAASSIPANIAEGYGRFYFQDTIRFCYIARGSLMELSSHLDLAQSQNFINTHQKSQLDEKAGVILKLIHGYIKYLKQSKRGLNEPGAPKLSENVLPYSVGDDYAPETTS